MVYGKMNGCNFNNCDFMVNVVAYPCKIYVSGKISGLDKNVYEQNFRLVKWILQKRHGHQNVTIVLPIDLKPFLGIKMYWGYMISDLWALMHCDAIYMQKNWVDSRGARIELRFAKIIRKQVLND